MRVLEWGDVSNILTLGGTILGTSNQANPQQYAIQRNGQTEFADVTDRVLEHVHANHLDAIVCIGGDGTMTGAANLIKNGINCIGVPKTIDNDLEGCDQTFGFDTAVTTAAECLDKIHSTAMSHHRVMVVEVMGRNAGWLALHTGLASGGDVVLIPEIPYDIDKIHTFCRERMTSRKAFTIVVVAEGAKPIGGEQIVDRIVADSPDPIRLGGIAHVLQRELELRSGIETRAVVLGHVLRGGAPCAADRVLATRFGHAAAELLAKGDFNRLVVVQNGQMTSVPIEDVADKQRLVTPDDELIKIARSVGTCFGD
jgi:6-phosphofructokinase 1